MPTTIITSRGQITIPLGLRQRFGLRQGIAVSFTVKGDHIALRQAPSARQATASVFGLIQSQRPAVPAGFDAADLAAAAP